MSVRPTPEQIPIIEKALELKLLPWQIDYLVNPETHLHHCNGEALVLSIAIAMDIDAGPMSITTLDYPSLYNNEKKSFAHFFLEVWAALKMEGLPVRDLVSGRPRTERKVKRDIYISQKVFNVESGVTGYVVKFYTPTACKEQTMVKTEDGRFYHAPTETWQPYGYGRKLRQLILDEFVSAEGATKIHDDSLDAFRYALSVDPETSFMQEARTAHGFPIDPPGFEIDPEPIKYMKGKCKHDTHNTHTR